MTDQPQTALDLFLAAAKRVESIIAAASDARSIPKHQEAIAKSVRIDTPSWTIPKSQELAYAAAERIRDAIAAEYRAAGEHRRDERLAALAAELQSIRAALPGLAARAAIELGHQSRMLEHEANGGSDG